MKAIPREILSACSRARGGKDTSQYVSQARVRQLVTGSEQTDGGLKQIAAACGFGSADVMRRAFLRFVGTTPHRYRRQLHDLEGALNCGSDAS